MVSIKEVANLFGYEVTDDKDFDLAKFKTHVDGKYITRDAALEDDEITSRITGKRMGIITTRLAQAFGFKAGELRDKKVEDLIELAATNTNNTIEELKKKATDGNDKLVAELARQLEEKDRSLQDFQKLSEDTKNEFESFKASKDSEIKNYKIGHKLGAVKAQIPFVDGFEKDTVRKTGFETLLNSKYQFDLNDSDELVVKDKKGHRIKHPTKTGEHADAATILTFEAEANNLLKKNNARPATLLSRKEGDTGSLTEKKTAFKANPKAVANAERK